jgi:hypothetical protein
MASDRAPALRPLGVGDVLDELFTVYRRGFKTFLGISVLVDVPITILYLPFVPAYVNFMERMQQASGGTSNPGAFVTPYLGWGLAGIPVVLLTGMAHLLWLAATCYATSAVYLAQPLTVGGAYRLALGRFWAMLRLVLLGALFVVSLTILAFVPVIVPPLLCISMPATLVVGIYLLVKWSIAAPALVLEERMGAVGALRRSWELVRGGWWRMFATFFVLSLLVGVLQSLGSGLSEALSSLLQAVAAPGATFRPAWIAVFAALLASAVGILWGPLMYIGLTVMYYDRRVRVEAYDLSVLAQDMLRQQRPEPIPP